jgi:hypothetical protein
MIDFLDKKTSPAGRGMTRRYRSTSLKNSGPPRKGGDSEVELQPHPEERGEAARLEGWPQTPNARPRPSRFRKSEIEILSLQIDAVDLHRLAQAGEHLRMRALG